MPYPLPSASSDLSRPVALVTGASSGLGYRFARVLAAAGARVAIAARRMDRLEAPGRIINLASMAAFNYAGNRGLFVHLVHGWHGQPDGRHRAVFPSQADATPAQMDSTLLFLASPASEAVTGTAIRIADGQGSR